MTAPTSAIVGDLQIARELPEHVCRAMGMVAYGYDGQTLLVAITNPGDGLAARLASSVSGRHVRLVEASAETVTSLIDEAFSSSTQAPATEPVATAPSPAAEADEPVVTPRPERISEGRLGDLLIETGAVTEDQIDAALLEQHRSGGRIGEILVHSGAISEEAMLAVLSEHFDVQHVDLTGFEADPTIVSRIPERLAWNRSIVPVAEADDGRVLFVAVAEQLGDESRASLEDETGAEIRELLATRSAIDELLRRVYSDAYARQSTVGLMESNPQDSAHEVLTPAQKVALALVLIALVVALVLATVPTLIAVTGACSVFYLLVSLYRFRLVFLALGHRLEITVTQDEIDALDEHTLPIYTLLLPLYKEANIVSRLASGIDALDYPRTKLDVKLLCEEDDVETIEAIRALHLPPHYQLIIVPDSLPKTKPKACNFGLPQARGELVVIYDGEDRPDPDQLKKAVVAFRKSPSDVTCIQAKLNFFNRDQNLLTRWFSIEYAMHFDLVLPGLDQAGVPIPLGGTSNHFVTSRLRELGAWDPYNVTEDADLGVRLHKAGYATCVMDSTTLEEANSELGNWIRQRSRWCKGYYQTWLVHMRNPIRLLRQLGLKSFVSFNLVVGGAFVFLLNPIFWTLTTLFVATQAGVIQQLFPGFVFYAAASMLFIGNFTFLYVNVAGVLQRGYFELAKYALLSPIYWGLMSIAAWKGAIQLITKPFYWEKTQHGLDAAKVD